MAIAYGSASYQNTDIFEIMSRKYDASNTFWGIATILTIGTDFPA